MLELTRKTINKNAQANKNQTSKNGEANEHFFDLTNKYTKTMNKNKN